MQPPLGLSASCHDMPNIIACRMQGSSVSQSVLGGAARVSASSPLGCVALYCMLENILGPHSTEGLYGRLHMAKR